MYPANPLTNAKIPPLPVAGGGPYPGLPPTQVYQPRSGRTVTLPKGVPSPEQEALRVPAIDPVWLMADAGTAGILEGFEHVNPAAVLAKALGTSTGYQGLQALAKSQAEQRTENPYYQKMAEVGAPAIAAIIGHPEAKLEPEAWGDLFGESATELPGAGREGRRYRRNAPRVVTPAALQALGIY